MGKPPNRLHGAAVVCIGYDIAPLGHKIGKGVEGVLHVRQIPKNATHEQYAKATGLECLFGALYLTGQTARINELFEQTMEEPHAI